MLATILALLAVVAVRLLLFITVVARIYGLLAVMHGTCLAVSHKYKGLWWILLGFFTVVAYGYIAELLSDFGVL